MYIRDIIGKQFRDPEGVGLINDVEFAPETENKGRVYYYELVDGDPDRDFSSSVRQVLYFMGYYVVNDYGQVFDFRSATEYMDDEIKEKLNYITTDTIDGNQRFFDEYCKEHEKKFGEPFELAKENPVW